MIRVGRGDVVLIAFPFVTEGYVERKRRPAAVVQADRYNRRRTAVIIAAITSTRAHDELPCKVLVTKDSPAGVQANLRLDSIVDCQTLATVPRSEIVRRLGRFPPDVIQRIDQALQDALGLSGPGV
ncbi:MAG: type II toxin-antitoxin system PemK/MazF family toxin [Armatimonadota bacterium]|nr:type II toxin-antitoxin system PemK/MazF family toxin [Armatimonadota bacterium]MDR7464860.1 type II toxin-antitoxin system PemK/MazF family toxin [Armatimonadota bacterium]MDR7471005.1 type II toxin-antitoxin system PemK/MazF family toxin [Armatimonadota bacterium]